MNKGLTGFLRKCQIVNFVFSGVMMVLFGFLIVYVKESVDCVQNENNILLLAGWVISSVGLVFSFVVFLMSLIGFIKIENRTPDSMVKAAASQGANVGFGRRRR